MRDEMMAAVIRRALEHPEFHEQLMRDPEAALDAHGFALEDEELSEIKRLGSAGDGSSREQLRAAALRFGVDPDKTG